MTADVRERLHGLIDGCDAKADLHNERIDVDEAVALIISAFPALTQAPVAVIEASEGKTASSENPGLSHPHVDSEASGRECCRCAGKRVVFWKSINNQDNCFWCTDCEYMWAAPVKPPVAPLPEVAAMTADVQALLDALRPFAAWAAQYKGRKESDELYSVSTSTVGTTAITVGDLRRAASALKAREGKL